VCGRLQDLKGKRDYLDDMTLELGVPPSGQTVGVGRDSNGFGNMERPGILLIWRGNLHPVGLLELFPKLPVWVGGNGSVRGFNIDRTLNQKISLTGIPRASGCDEEQRQGGPGKKPTGAQPQKLNGSQGRGVIVSKLKDHRKKGDRGTGSKTGGSTPSNALPTG